MTLNYVMFGPRARSRQEVLFFNTDMRVKKRSNCASPNLILLGGKLER